MVQYFEIWSIGHLEKKMEEIVLRFPHLSDQVFKQLDSVSLVKSRLVSKEWCKYLDQQKLLNVRMIRATIEKYQEIDESWQMVFKSCNTKNLMENICKMHKAL